MTIKARITNNKRLMLADEFIEGQSIRFCNDGKLYASELIEEISNRENPTFTRSSPAYLSSGTQVPANVPRFEQGRFGKAVMVEEGTTNLISNSDVETDTTGWTTDTYAGSGNFVNDNIGFGSSKSLKIQALADNSRLTWITPSFTLTENTTYTVSVYIKVSGLTAGNIVLATAPSHVNRGSIYLKFATIASGNTDWIRVTANITVAAGQGGSFKIQCWAENVNNGAQVWFDRIQVEQKPYPTSFTDGTRAAERLTIPTEGVLNPQEGTVECWFYIPYGIDQYDYSRSFLGTSHTGNYFLISVTKDGRIRFASLPSELKSSNTVIYDDWNHVVLRWNSQGRDIFLNGVKTTSTGVIPAIDGDLLYIGSGVNVYQLNGLIDDLRISNRARSDEEILAAYQSGKTLPVDKDTTYKLNFEDSLILSKNIETFQVHFLGKIYIPELIEGVNF